MMAFPIFGLSGIVPPMAQASSSPSSPSETPVGTRRKGRRSDIFPTAMPAVSPEDWIDPQSTLVTLYRRAEREALDAISWYLLDKRGKKKASRTLRAFAILFASAGGLIPLITVAARDSSWAPWGYVLLAAAASCLAFDRFFGLSAAWMRDIVRAQELQRRLEIFQYEWVAICAAPGVNDVSSSITLLHQFVGDINDLIHSETSEWITEFQSSLARLETSAADPRSTSMQQPH
jgi:hypothetical protein